ncbi:EamA family transporter [Nioella sediminis]|jgi:drug/metabolite transporter (DMT)-like permease|uniref:EamA family transporter n=1 Tax=Nioella sediminis TaxID=1912092 RepID=UPI0008FCED2B|nr:EamA family transporter [Nioella sediminis]TBX20975.1 peptide ABC transporter permease [Roseovarius sp. JS7-11]
MSLTVLLAVLGAALLHAGWNAIIKTGLSKQTSMFLLSVGHAAIGFGVALTKPFPVAEAWPWLLASGLIHMAYQLFLAFAYEQGDLSRVYPLARGAAPMMVLVVSVLFLSDPMGVMDYVGVLVLGLGIAFMARGVFTNGESRRLLPFALGSAMATAGYTLADGLGARVAGDPLQYVGWLMMLSALFYTPAAIALRGVEVIRASRRDWIMGLIAAAASFAAYAIAVWAMTVAPLALVAALRETSILFAVLLGWLLFGDKMDRGKIIAAVLIVSGVVLTRL